MAGLRRSRACQSPGRARRPSAAWSSGAHARARGADPHRLGSPAPAAACSRAGSAHERPARARGLWSLAASRGGGPPGQPGERRLLHACRPPRTDPALAAASPPRRRRRSPPPALRERAHSRAARLRPLRGRGLRRAAAPRADPASMSSSPGDLARGQPVPDSGRPDCPTPSARAMATQLALRLPPEVTSAATEPPRQATAGPARRRPRRRRPGAAPAARAAARPPHDQAQGPGDGRGRPRDPPARKPGKLDVVSAHRVWTRKNFGKKLAVPTPLGQYWSLAGLYAAGVHHAGSNVTMAKREELIVGLDIGTTKIAASSARSTDERARHHRHRHPPSRGLKKGVMVNIDSTVAAIRQAIEEAERMSGVRDLHGLRRHRRRPHQGLNSTAWSRSRTRRSATATSSRCWSWPGPSPSRWTATSSTCCPRSTRSTARTGSASRWDVPGAAGGAVHIVTARGGRHAEHHQVLPPLRPGGAGHRARAAGQRSRRARSFRARYRPQNGSRLVWTTAPGGGRGWIRAPRSRS